MKANVFTRKADDSGSIARERLKLMAEAVQLDHSPAAAGRMKKEISEIISRYFEIAPDNYEIRVVLKPNRKRA